MKKELNADLGKPSGVFLVRMDDEYGVEVRLDRRFDIIECGELIRVLQQAMHDAAAKNNPKRIGE